MTQLNFYIQDRQNTTQKEEIKNKLFQLECNSSDLSSCNLLLVHQSTDAPKKTGGIDQNNVDQLLARNGIYIEYTTSNAQWELKGKNQFYGSHREFINIISSLSIPISLDTLLAVLEKNLTFKYLVALSILCQGYLAVHSDSSFYQNLEESVKKLLKNVNQKAKDTEKSGWWQYPFMDIYKNQKSLTDELTKEWRDTLPTEISELAKLIDSNKSITSSELVETVYEQISKYLES